MTTNIKLPQGYKLIANYNDEIVLAQSLHEENPEPYVTWMVHDSEVHTGCYFKELSQAQRSFAERAFEMSEIMAEYESKRLKRLLERLDNCEDENVLMMVRAIVEYAKFVGY